MKNNDIIDIINRIAPQRPTDLDDILAPIDPRQKPAGTFRFPADASAIAAATPLENAGAVCFGARVDETTKEPQRLAMNVAQLAAEKGAIPVIFSYADPCPLGAFGFRIERIVGRTEAEREAAQAQVRAFWNIAMVI